MTVRWKPLLILSGLFVVVALTGLMAIALVKGTRGSADILARAKSERKAGKYDNAELDYQRVLKLDPKNTSIHDEMADLYQEWAATVPAERKAVLRGKYLACLLNSAKSGSRRVEPRKRMLTEAIKQDDVIEQVRWAKDLITLDPNNGDAHYVLASDAAEASAPNIFEVRKHLKVIDLETPRRPRADWITAKAAMLANDMPKLEQVLTRVRTISLPPEADAVDRMCLLKLRVLDVEKSPDPSIMAGRIDAVAREALFAADEPEIPSTRIARIGQLIEAIQRYLAIKGVETPAAREKFNTYSDSLDKAAEGIFQKSLAVKPYAELDVYLAYAYHLSFRDHRDRCLEVVTQGLKSPAGLKGTTSETALGLHALAAESALADFASKTRYDVAEPHIKALLECKLERYQALGHLFQGAIDLEKAGMVADAQALEVPRAEQSKLRASALNHLKIAAAIRPVIAEAQARYGVALILNNEPSMGRQYLQFAQRLGNLQPQYQIWAAWSVVQAGYPEDAQPIVDKMLQAIEQGRLPRNLEGTLHLLNGEIHQSRRTPDDLRKAIAEYSRAFGNGQDATPAVELRLAQIEVMLGRSADALKRIDWLASKDKAGPAAENLAIMTLQEMKRDDDAMKRLTAARVKFPESSELVVLESTLLIKAKQPEEAERKLSAFLEKVPDNIPVVQQKAQILAQDLNNPTEARRLLNSVADHADNSAPLVQLALLDLQLKDYDAVSVSIAKIRQRWKEAATGDLLDAQLSLAKQDNASASNHFEAALKKDPNNKLVQFYKAQLDGRVDPEGSAKVFEALIKEDSIKEIETGLSLTVASRSALASIAMDSGDLDSAILRYRDMLKQGVEPSIARQIRWQLVTAQAAKKEWPAAKSEMESLLNDPKSPATPKERVLAATFYRLNKEDAKALSMVDAVLKDDPTHAGAVVTRAEILARTRKPAEAIATINRSIAACKAIGKASPAVLYLMMAAVETTVSPNSPEGYRKAMLVLDQGLEAVPDSTELVQAKTRILTLSEGPKAALAFIEDKAKADPKGPYRRMLMVAYRDQGDFAGAERVAAELIKENANDANSASDQVRMIAAQSVEATRRGDRAEAKRLDDRASTLIYDYRGRWKLDPTFTQLDCELETRRGNFTRALSLTQDVDNQSKNSAVGPLLRAQIFTAKDQTREAAAAYAEAIARNPRLPEARLQLARLSLRLNQTDEAIRQAHFLQDADPDRPTGMAALLVEARATAIQPGSPSQMQSNRARAIERLATAIKNRPDFLDAYYQTAEIYLMGNDRAQAVATLKSCLKANPGDVNALGMAIQYLTERRAKTQPASRADLEEASVLARTYGDDDTRGDRALAISNGYTRANQQDLALPWAEKATSKLNSVGARLALGDILLTMSEAQTDQAKGRALLDRAMTEYDKILAAQPNLIEAVNNKAWILHSYLGKSQAALELAQGLIQRVDTTLLPGEFYDTLGSIQEELGRSKDAEDSYKKGLGKSPDHPVLNYHMGRLMAADKTRVRKAADYLKVAEAGRDRLPAAMADKLNSLLLQVGN